MQTKTANARKLTRIAQLLTHLLLFASIGVYSRLYCSRQRFGSKKVLASDLPCGGFPFGVWTLSSDAPSAAKRSAREQAETSSTPFFFAQSTHRSTRRSLFPTIWVKCTVASLSLQMQHTIVVSCFIRAPFNKLRGLPPTKQDQAQGLAPPTQITYSSPFAGPLPPQTFSKSSSAGPA